MQLLSIPDAARELEVDASRARSLAASGELAGVKIGGRWLVDPAAVARRKQSAKPPGRPLEPSNAWGAIFLISGEEAPWLDAQARWRIHQALRAKGFRGLMPRLSHRAKPQSFYAHRGEIPHLAKERGVVKSGISAASAHHLDLAVGNEIDVYVRANQLARIERDHALRPAIPGEANVLLRVVPDSAWYLDDFRVAPLAAVAMDLAEDSDSRSSRAGKSAIAGLEHKIAEWV